jgi:hypothetical protein
MAPSEKKLGRAGLAAKPRPDAPQPIPPDQM